LLADKGSVAYVMKAHLETEAYLKALGLRFTVLKNGVYTEAWSQYLGDVSGGEAVVPADGPVSWVARNDLAEGVARLLAGGGHAGQTLALTGPEALDIAATAAVLSRIRGRPVVRRLVTVEEYVARLMAAGKPEEFARQWATTYAGMARGEFGRIDPFLANLLDRPLRTLAEVLAAPAPRRSWCAPLATARVTRAAVRRRPSPGGRMRARGHFSYGYEPFRRSTSLVAAILVVRMLSQGIMWYVMSHAGVGQEATPSRGGVGPFLLGAGRQ
jgi:hypothetical protein